MESIITQQTSRSGVLVLEARRSESTMVDESTSCFSTITLHTDSADKHHIRFFIFILLTHDRTCSSQAPAHQEAMDQGKESTAASGKEPTAQDAESQTCEPSAPSQASPGEFKSMDCMLSMTDSGKESITNDPAPQEDQTLDAEAGRRLLASMGIHFWTDFIANPTRELRELAEDQPAQVREAIITSCSVIEAILEWRAEQEQKYEEIIQGYISALSAAKQKAESDLGKDAH